MTLIENWGSYERNVYYSPEKCGMRLLGSLEDGNASYSFYTVIVVQDEETGKVSVAPARRLSRTSRDSAT